MTIWLNYENRTCDLCGREISRPNFPRHRAACERRQSALEVRLWSVWNGGAWVVVNGEVVGTVVRDDATGLWDYTLKQPNGDHEYGEGASPRRRDAVRSLVHHLHPEVAA